MILGAMSDYKTYLGVLRDIIMGTEKEYVYDYKKQRLLDRPAPLDVRVKAIKVWKELTLDKVIADKKMLPVLDGSETPGDKFIRAVQEVESRFSMRSRLGTVSVSMGVGEGGIEEQGAKQGIR